MLHIYYFKFYNQNKINIIYYKEIFLFNKINYFKILLIKKLINKDFKIYLIN